MQQYILVHHKNEALGDAWQRCFAGCADVTIVGDDICRIECDAIASPGNSFGFMDGSLDLHLSERLGWHVQAELQRVIAARPLGELLIGEAVIVATRDALVPWLIAAPTMRVPMRLRQTVNPYLAMKAILLAALAHHLSPPINTVAIPGLGTGCGAVPAETAAKQMFQAYAEIVLGQRRYPADFGEAQHAHLELNPEINLWDK